MSVHTRFTRSSLVAAAVSLCVTHQVWAQLPPMLLYVSPKGSDTGTGTQARPFASLERAREEISAIRRRGGVLRPVTVYIRGGEYEMRKPVIGAINGSAVASSPENTRKFFGRPLMISMTCEKFPDASFVATMFSCFAASLSVVPAEMFDDVRPGTL